VGGPFHEPGKIINKRSLDLIFAGLGILRLAMEADRENHAKKQDDGVYCALSHQSGTRKDCHVKSLIFQHLLLATSLRTATISVSAHRTPVTGLKAAQII
jgi:hypothetical protein